MKYVVNLACKDEFGIAMGFSSGKYGFEVTAGNMSEAKDKVIARAKKDGFFNAENIFTADIIRLLPGGRRDIGLDYLEHYSSERNQTLTLAG